MAEVLQTLAYQPPPPQLSAGLRLVQEGGDWRLIFPLTPRWLYFFNFTVTALGGVLAFLPVLAMWSLSRKTSAPFGIQYYLPYAGTTLFCLSALVTQWYSYRRSARIPVTLVASSEGILISQPRGVLGVREQQWTRDQIRTIGVKHHRSIIPGLTSADLLIYLNQSRRRRFMLRRANSIRTAEEFVKQAKEMWLLL